MKLRNVSIFAVAAMVALSACGGDDDAVEGDDTTAVVVDTPMAAPLPADTSMAAPMPMDTTTMPADTTGGMGGDTTGGDTTKAP